MTARNHHVSFRHAWDGISNAVSTQPNFKVHLCLSLLTISGGIFFHISDFEWAILALVISSGLGFELINTAIEYTVDLLARDYRLEAKLAKDTAAGAMLVYTFGATIIALVIFLPKIWLYF